MGKTEYEHRKKMENDEYNTEKMEKQINWCRKVCFYRYTIKFITEKAEFQFQGYHRSLV